MLAERLKYKIEKEWMEPNPMPHEIMQLSNLPTFMMNGLQADYIIHDHANVKDVSVLERVTALVGDDAAKVDRNLLSMLPNVKMIAIFGEGYDFIDVTAAKAKGIAVTYTPGLASDDAADLAMGLILSAARRIPQAERFLRAGDWVSEPFPLSRKVCGSRLGCVGSGRIAQALAQRAQAFGMSVAYTDASASSALPWSFYPSLEALAAEVDFLVVCEATSAQTAPVVDASVLRALGAKGYLINVAKAACVDQQALIQALKDKAIAGAGLDVFWDEPRVPSELRTFANVVLTPHITSATHETRRAMADLALANLKAFYNAQPLLSPVPECQEPAALA